jgi:hypothetical protein
MLSYNTILLSQKINRFYFLYSKLLNEEREFIDSCNQDLKIIFNSEKNNFNKLNKTSGYSMNFETYINNYFYDQNDQNIKKIPSNILNLKICNCEDLKYIEFIEKINKYLDYILMYSH